jgi:hypothetical protein
MARFSSMRIDIKLSGDEIEVRALQPDTRKKHAKAKLNKWKTTAWHPMQGKTVVHRFVQDLVRGHLDYEMRCYDIARARHKKKEAQR